MGQKHDLSMIGALVTIKGAEVWATKKAKGLLKHGRAYPARNDHLIRVGYIAWGNGAFTTKDGQRVEVPEKYYQYMHE